MAKPKVLYLASNYISGQKFGAQMRAFHIGEALKRTGDVTIVIARSGATRATDVEKAKKNFDCVQTIKLYEPQGFSALRYFQRNLGLRIEGSFGLACSQEDRRDFRNSMAAADVVWTHGARVLSALGALRKTKTFVDIDDIESQIVARELEKTVKPHVFFKTILRLTVLRAREKRIVTGFGGIGVCSQSDKQYLGGSRKISVIPNGFDKHSEAPRRAKSSPSRVGFIGRLDYPPNFEGLKWFLERSWPSVKAACPASRIRIIGSYDRGELGPQAAGVDLLGYVEDPAEEISTWSLMVVPILTGGGTRVKIAEAFSRKCPVVATRLGAYGYDVADGRELLIADTPDEFAAKCARLLKNPQEGERLAEAAWEKFLKEYSWDSIYPRVEKAVFSLLENASRTAG